ncbi:MAG TPA: GNAT family N-acetyltransferase [Anaerolineales bacterium]|nr:GNAT family N-acetyltransferase [Anaerolineales bacterium]
MSSFEIRLASPSDIPRLMALDHSSTSDYVWQLELRRESGQVTASFREVRLPRSIEVKYPRNPFSLAEEWMRRDVAFVAVSDGIPVGYTCVIAEPASAVAWVTDLAVSPEQRRKGAASELLKAAQTWALERNVRRLILEMQSKNQAYIRLAQKFGYEFCGYNDQYYLTQDVALFFGRVVKS